MISESMGKILGMVMAYGVSSLGLLLAYVNYRKRIVKAERVMSGTAWGVIAAVVLVALAGAWAVGVLSTRPSAPVPESELAEAAVTREISLEEPVPPAEPPAPPARRWSWVGVLIPAAIFAFATWITGVLHRHFTRAGHGGHPEAGGGSPA